MRQHYSTGEAARLIQQTEPALNRLIRGGRIQPEPEIVGNRRLWTLDQIRQAAECLGTVSANAIIDPARSATIARTSTTASRGDRDTPL